MKVSKSMVSLFCFIGMSLALTVALPPSLVRAESSGPKASSFPEGPSQGVIKTGKNSIVLPISILHEVGITSKARGDRVQLEGFISGGAPGEPELPFYEFCFLLPQNVVPGSVRASLEDAVWEDVPGRFDIAPAPPIVTWVDGKMVISWGSKVPEAIINGRDVTIYETGADFPVNPLAPIRQSKYRQWNLGYVILTPIVYNPARNKIQVLRSGTIRLNFERKSEVENIGPGQMPSRSGIFWRRISPRLENPGGRKKFYRWGTGRRATTYADYVIITTNYIQTNSSGFNSFMAHKQAQGFSVAVITEGNEADNNHYLTGSTARKRSENIRSWLKDGDRYLNWGIGYVLLIGNPDPRDESFQSNTSLPMMRCYGYGPESPYFQPSDMYFAEVSGDWDLNQNNFPGEFGTVEEGGDFGDDGIDRNCELAVGRIPFYGNFSDLNSILEKIIDYENAAGDLSWRKKLLAPAGIVGMGPSDGNNDCDINDDKIDNPYDDRDMMGNGFGEALRDLAAWVGYTSFVLYEQEGPYDDGTAYPTEIPDAPLTKENLQNEWVQHYGFMTWFIHGAYDYVEYGYWTNDDYPCPPGGSGDHIIQVKDEAELSYRRIWTSADCNSLDDDFPSFTVHCCCNNGLPEYPNNLGYALLKRGAIGTVSATGPSGSAGTYSPNLSTDGRSFGYWIFNRMTSLNEVAGHALNWCRLSFLTPEEENWGHILKFNLYGDPSTTIMPFDEYDIGLRCYDGKEIISIACQWGGPFPSPLKIHKAGKTYGVALVDPSDPNASKIRIQTSSGIRALRKY